VNHFDQELQNGFLGLWHSLDYYPYDKQLDFHLSKDRFRLIEGACKSGKTWACAVEWLQYSIENPGSYGWVCAEDKETMVEAGRLLDGVFQKRPDLLKKVWRFKDRIQKLETSNGSTLEFKSMKHTHSLYAINLDFLWVEEMSHIKNAEAWYILYDRIGHKMAPMIANYTPKGTIDPPSKAHFVWREFIHEKKYQPCTIVKVITADNPSYPSEQIKAAKLALPSWRFKNQYLAEWGGPEGDLYIEDFDENLHVIKPDQFVTSGKKIRFLRAFDFGMKEPYCMLLGAYDEKGQMLTIFREYYKAGKDSRTNAKACASVCKSYTKIRNWKTLGDPSGMTYRADLSSFGMPCDLGNNIRVNSWVNLAALFVESQHKIRIRIVSTCENLIREINNLKTTGGDLPKITSATSDHALDAMRYLVMEIFSESSGVGIDIEIENEEEQQIGTVTRNVSRRKRRWV